MEHLLKATLMRLFVLGVSLHGVGQTSDAVMLFKLCNHKSVTLLTLAGCSLTVSASFIIVIFRATTPHVKVNRLSVVKLD